MKQAATTLFFLLLSLKIFSQYNLIADSSFEKNKSIPIEYSSLGLNNTWSSATRGTPDLFCKCKKKQDAKISRVNVPSNAMGVQEANSGNCYAGIFAVSHGYYREYIQTTLNGALQPGKEYELTLHISLSDYSPLAVDRLGVCFLNNTLKIENSEPITNLKPINIELEEEVGLDITEWHKVSVRYKAKGGENTLLIGSFGISRLWKTENFPPFEVSTPIYKKKGRDAYYYFDDISLHEFIPEPIDTAETRSNPYFDNMKPDSVEAVVVLPDTIGKFTTGKVLIFKNLNFKTGEATLQSKKSAELAIIVMYMKADKKLKIEITGHTDNLGDEEKNKQLSFNRAKAVADYLIDKGVNPANISYKGLGSSSPLETNDTEQGRKKNRRVEFMLVE